MLEPKEKLALLEQLPGRVARHADRWVEAGLAAKGLAPDSPYAGEEWTAGPWATLHGLNILIRTLGSLAEGERLPRGPARTRHDGQVVVEVAPLDIWERLLLSGFSAEIWMQPGVTLDNLEDNRAHFYRQGSTEGRVALILGAGNVSSISPLDVLSKMVEEGMVCLLKMSPVIDYVGPILEEIFAPLVDRGFLRIAYGGTEVGTYLVGHDGIDVVHMTGSNVTHDAIVFGPGPEGEERRRRGEPLLDKPITSELGGVTPTIVVPGPWSERDLRYQAEHIATQKLHNVGFNCVAAQVLVLPADWDRTDRLLAALRETLRSVKPRPTYYPGAADRQQKAVRAHPGAEVLQPNGGSGAARTLIPGLDPEARGDISFREEHFGPVLAQTSLPGGDARSFLGHAVKFCNEQLQGSLAVNLIVHPQTAAELGGGLDDLVSELCYGTVGINVWAGAAFLLFQASWGAFPGHTLQDVQSGIGVVHNGLLFDKPERTVVRGPFYPFPRSLAHGELHWSPKPPWFVTHRQAHVACRRLTRFAAARGWRHLPGIFLASMRG
ncbi:MAG: aldehyde dehydrogenase family protein [Thermoanaerobaculia bacterium]